MFRKRSFTLFLITLLVLGLFLVPTVWAEGFTVTILHTNDTHAHLESFQPYKQPLQGGVARRKTAIEAVRAEGGNVLLLDAGDVFQGTLYFNQHKGLADAWFMNEMGYDAMAVGNHEFDAGQQVLADFIDAVNFPLLSANLDFSGTDILRGKVKPWVILEVGGEKIGIFGLTTPEVKIISNMGEGIEVLDVFESAKKAVAELEAQGINKIIGLSHASYKLDKEIAAAVSGIDVMVSGHSHTPLGDMPGAVDDYPTVVTAPDGNPVLIVSAWEWGRYLGRLDVTFDDAGVVQSYEGKPIFIDESIPEDPDFVAKLAEFAAPIEQLKNTIIGQTAVELVGEKALVRSQETNLGNLVCDAILWKTAPDNTVIAIQNGGGIRASIPPGDVTMGQILEVLPFGNQIVDLDLTGEQIIAALENGVSQYEETKGRFPQVGGLSYTFDPSKPVGSRIISVEVGGVPIDKTATYRVATNDFMFGGGDGYDMLAQGTNVYQTGLLLSDALAEYIQAHSPVNPTVEGRITKVEVAALPVTGGVMPIGETAYVLVGFSLFALGWAIRRRQDA